MAAPNQTIRDSFTGSNGPLSANWTSGLYSSSVAPEIVGNAFGGPSGAGFFDAYWDAATFGTVNAEVYATVGTKSATGELMYLVLRAQSPGTTSYDAYTLTLTPSAGTDTIGVVRTVNETDTTITTRSQEVSAGDALALVALGAGATVTLQVWYRASGGSWTQLGADISDTDANRITAAGYIGAGVEGITGRWDDFGGGDHVLGTVEQEGYRWRDDDGSESAAAWLASQDTALTRDIGVNTRLRVLLNGTLDPASAAYQLEYRLSGGSYAAVLAAQPSAPTYQAAGPAASGVGAVSPAWPTHQAGDIGLLLIESAGGEAATLSTAAGFAAVTNSPQNTGATTTGTRITVFWARATSSSMATPTVADPGNHVHAIILTFRGCVASGDPWDVTAGAVKASASTSASAPGLTTTVDNTLVVAIIARDTDSAAAAFSAWANSDLTSVTERYDAGTTQGNGGGFGVATGVRASAGAVGTTTATVSSSINASLTIALLPLDAQPILLAASSNIAASAATATTAQLTAPSGKSTSDFDAGWISDDTNPLPSIAITTDDYTEVEWCLTAVSGVASASDVYEFRVTSGGTALDTYTVTPQWTIGSAASHDAIAASAAPAPTSAALAGSTTAHSAVAASTAPEATSAALAGSATVDYASSAASTAPAPTSTALATSGMAAYTSAAASSAPAPTSAALSSVTRPTYAATSASTAPAPTSAALGSRAASLRFYGVTTGNVGRVRIPLTTSGGSVATAVNVGAGNFTYEMWINCLYADNAATTALDVRYSNILLDRDIWNDSRGHVLGVARSGSNLVVLFGVAGAGSWTTIVGTIHVGDGQWHHIAVDRNAATGVVTIYVDGTADGNSTYTTGSLAYPTGYTPTGGQNNEYIVLGTEKHDVGGNGYTGLMDEVRISDNRRYTANFTRPSAPFTADANTAGLYHADSAPGAVLRDYATISGAPTDGALLIGGTGNGPTWQVESPFSTTSHPATSASTAPAATSAALSAVTQPGYAGVASSTAPAATSAALSAVTQPGYAGVASSVAPGAASAALSAVTQPGYAGVSSSTAQAPTSAATAASAAPGGSAATTSSTAPAAASAALSAVTQPAYAGQAASAAAGATSAALGAATQPAYPATATSTAPAPTSAAQAASAALGANTATAASAAPGATSAALGAVTQPSYSATGATSAPAATSQATGASAIPAYDVTGASIAPIPVSAAGASAAQPAYAVTAISTAPAPTSQAQASNATSYTVVAMAVAPAPSSQALAAHSVGGIGSLTLTIAAVGGMTLGAAAVGALDLGVAAVGSVALTIEPE